MNRVIGFIDCGGVAVLVNGSASAAIVRCRPALAATPAQDASERVAELLRQAIVQNGIYGAVGVEQDAQRDLYVPEFAQTNVQRLAHHDQEDPPELDGKHTHVEDDHHPHEHEDELLARLDVPLEVVVYVE